MTLSAPDYSQEWSGLDGVQDATLHKVDGLNQATEVTASGKALRKTIAAAAAAGTLTAPDTQASDVEIVWWQIADTDAAPAQNDVITLLEDNERYRVKSVGARERWGAKWRCQCRREVAQ